MPDVIEPSFAIKSRNKSIPVTSLGETDWELITGMRKQPDRGSIADQLDGIDTKCYGVKRDLWRSFET